MPSVTLRHHAPLWHAVRILRFVPNVERHGAHVMPAIAQLVEHLTVECCSNQMVPGSIPGGRTFGKVRINCAARMLQASNFPMLCKRSATWTQSRGRLNKLNVSII